MNVSRNLIRQMYLHGWHNYLKHGYPLDDLAPLSCAGKMTLGTQVDNSKLHAS
ncbi:hypothetical protein HMI56_006079 [Coelomomyces lativittatus]|nr:hypothetical protein HMI56_006079 [Coelomomyces lativittatus]